MNAPQAHPLQLVLEREEADRDSAAQAMQRAQQQLQRAQAQAAQLAEYRADYIRRWTAQFQTESTPQIMQCYRSFMQRLDQALAQQEVQVERAGATAVTRRADLLAAEQRVAAVKKLIERRSAEAQRAANRREQRDTDEAAQRSGAFGGGSVFSTQAGGGASPSWLPGRSGGFVALY